MSKKGPILIVDDDRDDQDLLKDIFKKLNVENSLHCFANGEEAINYLSTTTEQLFLILSDINMPVMDGIELRRRINSDEQLRRKSIPFIFLTTTASKMAVDQAYEMSVQGFFEKPSDFRVLHDLIDEVYHYWQRCRHPNNNFEGR